MISPEPIREIGIGVMVMVFSVCVTLGLVLFLNFVHKKTKSLVIKSDSLHYQTDLFGNMAVLVSLLLVYFTGFQIIDALLGLIIAGYIMYSAF